MMKTTAKVKKKEGMGRNSRWTKTKSKTGNERIVEKHTGKHRRKGREIGNASKFSLILIFSLGKQIKKK
jgi:hypothetical protein